MLYIKKFLENPLEWFTGVCGVLTCYFITQTFLMLVKSKANIPKIYLINIIGLLICIILTSVLFVLSLTNYINKKNNKIATLSREIYDQKDNLKKKSDNVKGLLQMKTELKNEINDYRSTIATLNTQVGLYKDLYRVILIKSDNKSIREMDEKIMSVLPQTMTLKEKEEEKEEENDR